MARKFSAPPLPPPFLPASPRLAFRGVGNSANQLNETSGLEADQRVLAVHECYALTATTGLTAQNTLGVNDIHFVPAQFVKKQVEASLDDVKADAVKLGRFHLFILFIYSG